jgi:hypothetical protein
VKFTRESHGSSILVRVPSLFIIIPVDSDNTALQPSIAAPKANIATKLISWYEFQPWQVRSWSTAHINSQGTENLQNSFNDGVYIGPNGPDLSAPGRDRLGWLLINRIFIPPLLQQLQNSFTFDIYFPRHSLHF